MACRGTVQRCDHGRSEFCDQWRMRRKAATYAIVVESLRYRRVLEEVIALQDQQVSHYILQGCVQIHGIFHRARYLGVICFS